MMTSQNSAQAIAKTSLDEESNQKESTAVLKQDGIEPDVVEQGGTRRHEFHDELLEDQDHDFKIVPRMHFSHCARGLIFCFTEDIIKIEYNNT